MNDGIANTLAVNSIAELARRGADPNIIDVNVPGVEKNIPLAFVWNKDGVQIHNLKPFADAYRDNPERREGLATAHTVPSFIDLVNRHKDEHSAIFADLNTATPSFTAVIDYHQTDHAPRFGKHRIHCPFTLSDEWKFWKRADGEAMGQAEFAELLEDRIIDLTTPTREEEDHFGQIMHGKFGAPNEIMQLARGLHVHTSQRIKNKVDLQSGASQITFEEEHQTSEGGVLTVPSIFMLQIPIFFGSHPIRIPVRLRYRARGAMTWFYNIYRPADFVLGALRSDLASVQKDTELPVFEGAPEIGARDA